MTVSRYTLVPKSESSTICVDGIVRNLNPALIFSAVQFNNPRIPNLTLQNLRYMQISHNTRQKPGNFCGMPHSAAAFCIAFHTTPHRFAPRRTIPRNTALVPQL
jgi:hypothetical protein